MAEARFTIARETTEVDGKVVRWAEVVCPHGLDIGAIWVTDGLPFDAPSPVPGSTLRFHAWHWRDLGNGTCEIAPSLLLYRVHNGQDCHFGPGVFPFEWSPAPKAP